MAQLRWITLFAVFSLAAWSGVAHAQCVPGEDGPGWADSVLEFLPNVSDDMPIAAHLSETSALGPADFNGVDVCPDGPSCKFVSLGSGGLITLSFDDNRLTGSDSSDEDLHIFEVGSATEAMDVLVSADGANFVFLERIAGDTVSIDLDAHGFGSSARLRYVRLIDDPVDTPGASPSIGADIDAVCAIATVAGVIGTSGAYLEDTTTIAGDPINTFTGQLYDSKAADLVAGGPMPLLFARTYDSSFQSDNVVGSMGTNWRHNFEWQLLLSGTRLDVIDPQGRPFPFEDVGAGPSYVGESGVPYQLIASGSGFTFVDPSASRNYAFNLLGELISLADASGNAHVITLTGSQLTQVSDGLGRLLTFAYDAQGHLQTVTHEVGANTRTVTFSYDGDDLASVLTPEGLLTSYSYDPGGRMTSTVWSSGAEPLTQTFNPEGKVATQSSALTTTYTLSYSGETTMVLDGVGNTRVHDYAAGGFLTSLTDPASNVASFGYDEAQRRRTSLTDRRGGVTSFGYDPTSGRLGSTTYPDGSTSSYVYVARTEAARTHYDLSQTTAADGLITNFSYGPDGNPTAVSAGGLSVGATFNSAGQPLTRINAAGGVRTFSYNPDGTLASSQSDSGHTTMFGYDGLLRFSNATLPDGATVSVALSIDDRPSSFVDELGGSVNFSYDSDGLLSSVSDRENNTTTYGRDASLRITSVADGEGEATQVAYDALDRITSITSPSGVQTQVGYDTRGRPATLTDGAGEQWTRAYDPEGALTGQTNPLLDTTTLDIDAMGRPTQLTSPLGNTLGVTRDLMGSITSLINGEGEVHTLTRDALSRITDITSPEGLVLSFTYNGLGQVTELVDPNWETWSTGINPEGQVTSTTDPVGNATTTSWNSRGRIATHTFAGALGSLNYGYDAAARQTSASYSDGQELEWSYDANGRLLTANDGPATADTLVLGYDSNGQIIASNGIAITRDMDQRLSTMTLATDKTVTYTYDLAGRLASVTDWMSGATTFTYDAAGQIAQITRPNGIATQYGWNADGYLASQTDGSLGSISLVRDAKAQIVSADRTLPDAGPVAALADVNLAYDAASQVVGHSYDAAGRRTSAGTSSYTWDLAGRLIGYDTGSSPIDFGYDGMGQRTFRTAGGSTQAYVMNYALRFPSPSVVVTDGVDSGFLVHSPDGLLLHRVDASGARRFYHYDEMGNTSFITDNAGEVIASYRYGPFGELMAESGVTDNPFKWQGELSVTDEGGGLFYMRARYYDVEAARFISRDRRPVPTPVRANPYQYAARNPKMYVDPTGAEAEIISQIPLRLPPATVVSVVHARPVDLCAVPLSGGILIAGGRAIGSEPTRVNETVENYSLVGGGESELCPAYVEPSGTTEEKLSRHMQLNGGQAPVPTFESVYGPGLAKQTPRNYREASATTPMPESDPGARTLGGGLSLAGQLLFTRGTKAEVLSVREQIERACETQPDPRTREIMRNCLIRDALRNNREPVPLELEPMDEEDIFNAIDEMEGTVTLV